MNIMPIRGFPSYYVTDTGLVLRQLTPTHRMGYNAVTLTKEGLRRRRGEGRQPQFQELVHRLVLETFRGAAPVGWVTRHLNGDRRDNRLENLVWGTPSENQMDRVAHGTDDRGSKNGMAKLSERHVRVIRRRRKAGWKLRELAEAFRTTEQNIHAICKRRTWGWLK